MFKEYFNMFSRNKTRVSHVYIDLASRTVSANGNPLLTHHILELPTF